MPYTSLSTTVETTTSGESPGTYFCYWIFSIAFIYLPFFFDLNVAWCQRNRRSFRATMIGWKGALSSNLSLMNYNISVYYIERRCLDRPRISGMRSNYFCHLLQVTLHLETSLLCSTSWIYLVPLCHLKWFLSLVFNTPYIFVGLLVGFTGRPLFTKTKRKTSWPTERNTLLITEQRKPRHKSNEPCFRNLYSAFLYSVLYIAP